MEPVKERAPGEFKHFLFDYLMNGHSIKKRRSGIMESGFEDGRGDSLAENSLPAVSLGLEMNERSVFCQQLGVPIARPFRGRASGRTRCPSRLAPPRARPGAPGPSTRGALSSRARPCRSASVNRAASSRARRRARPQRPCRRLRPPDRDGALPPAVAVPASGPSRAAVHRQARKPSRPNRPTQTVHCRARTTPAHRGRGRARPFTPAGRPCAGLPCSDRGARGP